MQVSTSELISPVLKTDRLVIRQGRKDDLQSIIAYFRENEQHLARSGPLRSAAFLTFRYWEKQVKADEEDFLLDKALRMFLFERDDKRVIGSVNFNAILRGAAQFCYLGYGISSDRQGQGLMFEAVNAGAKYVFEEMKIHRIMANYMPTNLRSGALLKKVGFIEEGFAKDYLYLNGRWCDHVMTAITYEQWLNAGKSK